MPRNRDEDVTGVEHKFYNTVIHGNAHLGNTYITQTGSLSGVDACRKALFLTDPIVDRETVKTEKGRRTAGTCEWIRNKDAYNAWLSGETPPLWISGSPGKGKTILSVFLTEELERHIQDIEDAELLFYFCTHQNEKRSHASAVFRSLAYQLLTKRRELFSRISSYFEDDEKAKATLSSVEALWIVLRTLLQTPETGDVFCVLDGLDECDEASQRLITSKFRDFFSSESSESSNRKLILGIVSRPIAGMDTFTQVKLDSDNDEYVDGDIRQFISASVGVIRVPGFDENLRVTVEETLLSRAHGTFLWIGFVMRELSSKATCTEIMDTLNSFPSGLPGMYSRMLQKTDPRRRSVISDILRWVALAFEPLTLLDLAFAARIRPSPSLSINQTMHDYVALCGGILKMTGERITLVHQSAKDYLLRAEVDNDPVLELFRIKGQEAHAELTTTCLDYIEKGPLYEGMPLDEISTTAREPPLLSYALNYWPAHARNSCRSLDWGVQLKRSFFSKTPKMMSWTLPHNAAAPISWSAASGPHVLHLACEFGVQELVRKLLSKKRRALGFWRSVVDAQDARGDTALFSAVYNDWPAVVQLLLSHGANINAKNHEHDTPMMYAIYNGNTGMVRLLLEHGADMSLKNREGKTPVVVAIRARYTAVARLLLERGAKIDTKGALLIIPLLRDEDIEMISLLIEYGADVNTKYGADVVAKQPDGWTLLTGAATSRSVAVLKVLLEHGADPGARDAYGYTALHGALYDGHEAIVQLLLDHGADVNEEYYMGATPLTTAVSRGDLAIVRLLLERGARVRSPAGREALASAFLQRNIAAVQLLLERGVDLYGPGRNGWMLVWAANKGDEELVRLFIEYGADVNLAGDDGCMPLQAARDGGHTEVVRLLESAGAYAEPR